jgi:Zn-dependent peptidase ImmA (M78 family)/transcriptional regulator with XRE-family HTH domain
MAASTSPVNPAVLSWALSEDGRPVEELAERIGVAFNDFQAWLSGDDSPTQGQLSKLADALGRSRAALLLPAPPVAATTPTAFRRAVGSDNETSAQARKAVRESRQIQKALSWIRRDQPPVPLPLLSYSDKPAAAAAAVREWSGVSVEDQFSWRTERDALGEWRTALDAKGVFVFALQIGTGEIRGFSDWDEYAPVIGINTSSITPAARIFSIAHELAHLTCRSDATCDDIDVSGVAQSQIESWCESFASSFLMPGDAVREAVAAQAEYAAERGKDEPSDIEQVRLVMRKFRVSARAAAIRLESLGVAPKGLYGKVNSVFVPKAPSKSGQISSPPRAVARVRQYGPEVIETVLNSLPPRDALRVLRINALDARLLAQEVPDIHGF